MFDGVAFKSRGGVTSFGPPMGLCMFAQPESRKNSVIRDKKVQKKSDFLFSIVFMSYKRFLLFDEDLYSKLKIIALNQNLYN
jgi:hypothetical protein